MLHEERREEEYEEEDRGQRQKSRQTPPKKKVRVTGEDYWDLEGEGEASEPMSRETRAFLERFAMSPEQKARVQENMHKLPQKFAAGLRDSAYFDLMPYSTFLVTLGPEEYARNNQIMGRILYAKEPALVAEMMRQDLRHLRRREEITARKARTFYFLKYGLSNRIVMEILRCKTMGDAIEAGETTDDEIGPVDESERLGRSQKKETHKEKWDKHYGAESQREANADPNTNRSKSRRIDNIRHRDKENQGEAQRQSVIDNKGGEPKIQMDKELKNEEECKTQKPRAVKKRTKKRTDPVKKDAPWSRWEGNFGVVLESKKGRKQD